MITSLEPTAGSAPDNKQLPELLAHDAEVGVTAEIYAGDKAYDDTDLHFRLWALGKHSALTLNDYRTSASNEHRAAWQRLKDSPEYQAGRAERHKVERKFGEAKRWHGFGRCRYLGLLRCGLQAQLTALVLNLKRIVTLLWGVRLRPTHHTRLSLSAYALGFGAPAGGGGAAAVGRPNRPILDGCGPQTPTCDRRARQNRDLPPND